MNIHTIGSSAGHPGLQTEAIPCPGTFAMDEFDSVTLQSSGIGIARTGRVNVDAHTIHISLAENGDLTVQVKSRANAAPGDSFPDDEADDAGAMDVAPSAAEDRAASVAAHASWSKEHGHAARLEGWDVHECYLSDHGRWQVQRLDSADEWPGSRQLDSDDDAWTLVLQGTGRHHTAALAFLREHNRPEYERIMAWARTKAISRPEHLGSTSMSAPVLAPAPTWSAERVLTWHGVFKGAEGLRGLANAGEFWDGQPYGTRLYFGPDINHYLHLDVLRAAIRVLDSMPCPVPASIADSGTVR